MNNNNNINKKKSYIYEILYFVYDFLLLSVFNTPSPLIRKFYINKRMIL